MPQLRVRQEEALDAVLQNYLDGIYQQLIVQATGTGKTVIFSNLYKKVAHLFGGKPRMLVFAHRGELIDQAIKSIRFWNPDLKVGKEMASDYADLDCSVVVSCVASIGREGATRLQRFGNFDIVVCDEAHHSIASTYMNVFQATGVLDPNSKRLLVGFTATPKRKNLTKTQKKQLTTLDDEDLLSLKSVYKKIVYTYTIRKAIKEGWLVPLRAYRLKTDTNLDNVKMTAGDFQQDQLSAAVNTDPRNALIVKSYLKYGEGRQTMLFSVDVDHAKQLAALFVANGVKAEASWGDDPERDSKLQRHVDGEFAVMCNSQLYVEGYDDWRISCVIPAAPTKSSSSYTQKIGRGTRLQEGTGNLHDAIAAGIPLEKKDCIIIDVVDNYKRCSLVTLPSLLGLNPEMDLQGGDVLAAAEKMEELQEKFPGVDFTHLTDLSKVDAYVESIDLFAAPYTEEVKEFSKLAWMATADGSYVLAIPEDKKLTAAKAYSRFLHEKLHITENDLNEYELSITTTQTDRLLGAYNSLKEAFETADDVIRRCRSDRITLMVREANWHSNAPSEAAKKWLRRLSKKKPMMYCLCDGWHAPSVTTCPKCGLKTGITAGQVAMALNKFKSQGATK
jgi:superfamily II DNA or RNA helicase